MFSFILFHFKAWEVSWAPGGSLWGEVLAVGQSAPQMAPLVSIKTFPQLQPELP